MNGIYRYPDDQEKWAASREPPEEDVEDRLYEEYKDRQAETYYIVSDYGKPDMEKVESDSALQKRLKELYYLSIDEEHPYFDVIVLNYKEEDITESQFISEMVADIMHAARS